jgi:hypothetical protein
MKVRAVICSLALAAFALIAACSARDNELKWTEDVQLQDGRVIKIHRHSVFRGPREAFTQKGANVSWYAIEFEHPATKEKVRWESKMFVGSDEVVKAAEEKREIMPSLILFAILAKDSDLFVLVQPHSSYTVLGCPDPPYLLYRWQDGRWRLTALDQIPHRKFAINVSLDDDRMRERIRQSKHHLGTDVTATQTSYGQLFVLDFSKMTKQTAALSNCERRVWHRWTDAEALSN